MTCKKATWAHSVKNFGASSDEVQLHVDRLAGAGFDLIIPCVKNPPGYLDFRTDVGYVNPDYPDWDVLAVLDEKASGSGMKVHPWFCVFREGDGSKLLSEHPEYAAVFESPSRWACACRPEVQNYVLKLYEILMSNYPVAGVHLDYILTGGLCQCDYCTAQMKQRGIDIHTVEPRDPGMATWVDWRCERVSAFVERLHGITQTKRVELSAAVFSGYPDCRQSNGQDWVAWAERKLVDFLFPMTYTNSTRDARMRTRCHRALVGDRIPIWEGLGKRSSASELSTAVMMEQIEACLAERSQGIVLFSYPALSDEDLAAIASL
jgi:uncharacterized lipoprotein YddW (UPF0748 family)